jgi:hypothetical protein
MKIEWLRYLVYWFLHALFSFIDKRLSARKNRLTLLDSEHVRKATERYVRREDRLVSIRPGYRRTVFRTSTTKTDGPHDDSLDDTPVDESSLKRRN